MSLTRLGRLSSTLLGTRRQLGVSAGKTAICLVSPSTTGTTCRTLSSAKSAANKSHNKKSTNLSATKDLKREQRASDFRAEIIRRRPSPSRSRSRPTTVKREYVLPSLGLTSVQLAALAELPKAHRVVQCARSLDETVYDGRVLLSPSLIELIVEELDLPLKFEPQHVQAQDETATAPSSSSSELVKRMPIVTVMGHVDHGKTSLLDRLRKTDVASGEVGGITQSVAAFAVRDVATFIDTPGHAAFSAMRRHGAVATDVVVLVVAVDDGVMPQTEESVALARAADVPIVVAITKVDKLQAPTSKKKRKQKDGRDGNDTGTDHSSDDPQLQNVRAQLIERLQLHCEQIGGDVQCVEVSAKSGAGIPSLLDAIALQADMMELKANFDSPASGICLESRVDRSLAGTVATLIVRDGVLRTGDFVVFHHSLMPASSSSSSSPAEGYGSDNSDIQLYGKVKRLIDPDGNTVDQALPGQAVGLVGLSAPIPPGSRVVVAQSERDAKAQAKAISARNANAVSTIQTANRLLHDRALKAHRSKIDRRVSARATVPMALQVAGKKQDSNDVSAESEMQRNMDKWLRQFEGGDGGGDESGGAQTLGGGERFIGDASQKAKTKPKTVVQVVVKGDVRGSADAVAQCVQQLRGDGVDVRVVRVGVGEVTDADVQMAAVSHDLARSTRRRRRGGHPKGADSTDEPVVASVVVCFNVRMRDALHKACDKANVHVVSHNIIYHVEEQLRGWIERDVATPAAGTASVSGRAGVRRVFEDGAIAGCMVEDGVICIGDDVHVMRPRTALDDDDGGDDDGGKDALMKSVHKGSVESIKQYAKDVRDVKKGFECGVRVSGWSKFETGDEIRAMKTTDK